VIDLDALKSELEAAGLDPSGSWREWLVVGNITAYRRGAVYMSPGDEINQQDFRALAIIARHVAPVVTPEPPAEVRDVLAEALKVYYGIPADERAPEADGIADAGLAALRDKGFAVVRTADVEAVTRYLDSQRDIWDERASRACDALEEAIR